MKKFISGLVASMFGAGVAQTFKFESTYNPPLQKKQTSQKGWRYSKPSEYFGKRSKIVTAYTKKGQKLMKLKNALKAGFEFDFK